MAWRKIQKDKDSFYVVIPMEIIKVKPNGGIRIDGKPSVQQIAEASQNGLAVKYEIVTYKGVEILMLKRRLLNAIETTCELTHDKSAIQLAKELGIKLRKFR